MLRFLLVIYVVVTSTQLSAQQPASYESEARQLKKVILLNHINPKSVDDLFSAFVFDHLLHELDPDKIYFNRQEITALFAYRNKIDEDLNTTSWNFLPAITMAYKKSLLRAEGVIGRHTASAFDLNIKESIVADTNFSENEEANTRRWYLTLKHETLNELVYVKKNSPDLPDKEFLLKKEADARLRTRKIFLRRINRILTHPAGYENHVASLFLRSISLGFDPHSSYFSPTDMENFMASLSTEGYYFGINVDENDEGEIVIT